MPVPIESPISSGVTKASCTRRQASGPGHDPEVIPTETETQKTPGVSSGRLLKSFDP